MIHSSPNIHTSFQLRWIILDDVPDQTCIYSYVVVDRDIPKTDYLTTFFTTVLPLSSLDLEYTNARNLL